jgi:hypothetical protein
MSKAKRFFKFILVLICIPVFIALVWTAFSLIGRVKAETAVPDSAVLRISVPNPVRLLDGVMSHESLHEISAVPALAQAASVIKTLEENPLLKNRFVRLAARGNIELAMLPAEGPGKLAAVWDMGFFSPLLRVLPVVSNFVNIPNLYYVQAGKNSRFEYRLDGMTLYIGPHRNLLFICDNPQVYEARSNAREDSEKSYNRIRPSSYDAVMLISPAFISALLADQDANIAMILRNIEFDSAVEAGISVLPKKIEFRLTAPLSSRQTSLGRLIGQRSQAPDIMERIPASSQYATILSAGTLDELFQAALVFSGPDLDDTIKRADVSARAVFGLTLNDLLFSWTGREFAAFGMEGRPHPVYAIQIADERKRQEVFDKAFNSLVLNESVRLNLDGVRIPRIEIPEFLQSLLRRWNLFLPSPYYTVHKDYLLVSESAETLLAALRAVQRNDVLPRTASWRTIAGGRTGGFSGTSGGTFGGTSGGTSASAFNLYYSLDLSVPFFLRKNTAISGFLSLYRQGLVRMGFDRGVVEISLSLVPGSGSGVTLVNALPLETAGRISNRVFGDGRGENSHVFLSAGSTVISVKLADNSVYQLSGQGQHWIIPADGIGERDSVNAWVVSDRGRVTLVNGSLEPAQGFPVLTGLRLSSPPQAHDGRLYICDEDGRVHFITANGEQSVWETSFIAALRSPPSFLTLSSRARSGARSGPGAGTYAAVYPKSFFGEIWLLDADGNALPNWPAPISRMGGDDDDGNAIGGVTSSNTGIGFGSPLLFAHNSRVHAAFVSQDGELSVYDENAASVSPFPLLLTGIFFQQPVFDGEYLWLISSDGTLFQVSMAGEILYQRIANFSVKEEGYLAYFDVDGDKVPEIFITGEGNALYAFTRRFRSLEGFPLPVWGKPVFADNGKGKTEIIGVGMDRRLYRWQFK